MLSGCVCGYGGSGVEVWLRGSCGRSPRAIMLMRYRFYVPDQTRFRRYA